VNEPVDLRDVARESEETIPSRRRRRRRGMTVALAATALIAVAVGVGVGFGTGDATRSGTLTTGQSTYVTDFWVEGEWFGETPRFAAFVTVPNATKEEMTGAKVEVIARVLFGCVGFGTQSKTFDWALMGVGDDPLNRQFVWKFPTTGSNVCVGSTYKVKARVKAANGSVTAWSAEASALGN
jgi:hypothetical protein